MYPSSAHFVPLNYSSFSQVGRYKLLGKQFWGLGVEAYEMQSLWIRPIWFKVAVLL
jgi:hypothetical protein